MTNSIIKKTACAVLLLGTHSAVFAQPQGDAEDGAQLYYHHGCYECHGYSGYGRVDLNNSDSENLFTDQVFTTYLRGREDVAPLLPSTDMPNYPANALSDEEARDIYAYILSMPDNRPEIADVPTLQAILESAEQPYQP